MTALLQSELLKLRTTRAVVAFPLALVALTALAVAATIGGSRDAERRAGDFQLDLVGSAGFAGVLALILGIVSITAEFRHGTITPTFLVAPVRERVLAAKAGAALATGALLAVAGIVVVGAVALPWLAAIDVPLAVGDGDVWTRAARLVLGAALSGAAGVAVGSIVHNQVGALVGALLWLLVVEPLIDLLIDLLGSQDGGRLLPGRALDAVSAAPAEDVLRFWPGLGLALAYVAALGALGALRTRGRDVTA